MRRPLIESVEKGRVKDGPLASTTDYGNNGAFIVNTSDGVALQIVCSDGAGWEHVSVAPMHKDRTPTWDEMCWIKDLFWEENETVIQYHPAAENYVNMHPNVLHLWKPTGQEIPIPPAILIGYGKKRKRH